MTFTLVRDRLETENPTRGTLTAGDLKLRTLELPWKDNLPSVSCIPPGTYPVVPAWSNRYQRLMPRLIGVPMRDGILIHSLNIVAETKGCIGVGLKDTATGIQQSKLAFARFFKWFGVAMRDGSCEIEVSYAA